MLSLIEEYRSMKLFRDIFKKAAPRKRSPGIIKAVLADSLTYLDHDALNDLYRSVVEIEHDGIPGILIEAGCALGGSAIVMAAAKSKSRPLFIYDVFGLIPPPTGSDGPDVHQRYEQIISGQSEGIGRNKYYGYEDNLVDKVIENFEHSGVQIDENNVQFVKGLFQETLHIRQDVVLAHIDCDWYESVNICLEQIAPNLVHGGRFIIDDYDDWSGCRSAVDEFFSDKKDQYTFVHKSRLHIVRK